LEPLFLRVNDGTNVKQNSVYIGKLCKIDGFCTVKCF